MLYLFAEGLGGWGKGCLSVVGVDGERHGSNVMVKRTSGNFKMKTFIIQIAFFFNYFEINLSCTCINFLFEYFVCLFVCLLGCLGACLFVCLFVCLCTYDS